jgi:hypothetical protein
MFSGSIRPPGIVWCRKDRYCTHAEHGAQPFHCSSISCSSNNMYPPFLQIQLPRCLPDQE